MQKKLLSWKWNQPVFLRASQFDQHFSYSFVKTGLWDSQSPDLTLEVCSAHKSYYNEHFKVNSMVIIAEVEAGRRSKVKEYLNPNFF